MCRTQLRKIYSTCVCPLNPTDDSLMEIQRSGGKRAEVRNILPIRVLRSIKAAPLQNLPRATVTGFPGRLSPRCDGICCLSLRALAPVSSDQHRFAACTRVMTEPVSPQPGCRRDAPSVPRLAQQDCREL